MYLFQRLLPGVTPFVIKITVLMVAAFIRAARGLRDRGAGRRGSFQVMGSHEQLTG
jgi:hypothetical protein